jgi:hypothetical protein
MHLGGASDPLQSAFPYYFRFQIFQSVGDQFEDALLSAGARVCRKTLQFRLKPALGRMLVKNLAAIKMILIRDGINMHLAQATCAEVYSSRNEIRTRSAAWNIRPAKEKRGG